jgi:hypothetical protein
MSYSTTDNAEFGQILAKAGPAASLTYEDIKGVIRPYELLTGSWSWMQEGTVQNTSEPFLARTLGQEFDFRFTYESAGSYMVRVRAQRDTGVWEPVQTVRSDTGAVSFEHTVTSLTLLLQTESGHIRDQCRVEVMGIPATEFGLSAGDTVKCFCRAM